MNRGTYSANMNSANQNVSPTPMIVRVQGTFVDDNGVIRAMIDESAETTVSQAVNQSTRIAKDGVGVWDQEYQSHGKVS